MIFDKQYYKDNNLERDHNHYKLRARWIRRWMQDKSGKVVLIGAGLGWTVYHLDKLGVNSTGVESSKHACMNSIIPLTCINARNFLYLKTDNVFSWNVLDCLGGCQEAELLSYKMRVSENQIHVLCTDNDDRQSEQYKKDGYFIKSMQYWMGLMPGAVFVDYHTGSFYSSIIRISDLKIPLSWGRISK